MTITNFATDPATYLALAGLCAVLFVIFAIQFGRDVKWTHTWEHFPAMMKTLFTLIGFSSSIAMYFQEGVKAAIITALLFIGGAILARVISLVISDYRDRRLARIYVTTDDRGEV